MGEEVKVPPVEIPKEKPVDTGTKSAEERVKELESSRVALEAQLKEKDSFIGRQSTEIGELRTKVKDEPPKEIPPDELEKEIVKDMLADGYTEESAKENAKTLAKAGSKVYQRERQKHVMNDVADMIEDSLEEGKFDKVAFEENKAAIMAEFEGRKLAPTARKNFRIFKDCYGIVVKKKAETMKEEQKPKEEAKRDALIAEGTPPPPGATERKATDEEKAYAKQIRDAGTDDTKRDSAFFS